MKEEKEELVSFAERIRVACLEAAQQGYESAKLSGLCHEGAWEVALDAMRQMDLEALVRR